MDYATIVKLYKNAPENSTRYSPPRCTGCRKFKMQGNPQREHVSTSYVERQNLSLRMGSRRFTRLTNGYSKRIENHAHAIALHYFHYNFIRPHATLRTTPAVAAGIADHEFTFEELVEMVEREEAINGGRLTNYLPSPAGASK